MIDTLNLAIATGAKFAVAVYPAMYLALSNHYGAKLTWVCNATLFAVSIPIIGAADLAIGKDITSPILSVGVLVGASLLATFVIIGSAFEFQADQAKALSKPAKLKQLVTKHLERLYRPEERIGFLVLVFGILSTLFGLVGFWASDGFYLWQLKHDLADIFLGEIRYRTGWAQWCARVGFLLAVLGYMAAYCYESTIGNLVRWIARIIGWIRSGR